MQVELIASTINPIAIMQAAARTCYSAKTPQELWHSQFSYNEMTEQERCAATEKKWKFIKKILASGHKSIAEHVTFTFAISGITRACSHQLVRHRHCTFSQQSQRYVEIKENLDELKALRESCNMSSNDATNLIEKLENINKLETLLRKYFAMPDRPEHTNLEPYYQVLKAYLQDTDRGIKAEDARQYLPNATMTNLVVTLNYAELIHICGLRLCTRAQQEIRQLAQLMVEQVKENATDGKLLAELLKPKCQQNRFCDEEKSCGMCKIRRIIDEQGDIKFSINGNILDIL